MIVNTEAKEKCITLLEQLVQEGVLYKSYMSGHSYYGDPHRLNHNGSNADVAAIACVHKESGAFSWLVNFQPESEIKRIVNRYNELNECVAAFKLVKE